MATTHLKLSAPFMHILFERCFVANKVDTQTSSFWLAFNPQIDASLTGDEINLSGYGFGEFRHSTIANHIKYGIPQLLCTSYKKQLIDPSLWVLGKTIANHQGRLFNFDMVRQILSLDSILCSLPHKPKSCAVIGDGYGVMASLLATKFPESAIYSINLGKQLLFDAIYSVPGSREKVLIEKEFDPTPALYFVEADNAHLLKGRHIELFINIASMQEMNESAIKAYFQLMRAQNIDSFLYCCNREEKHHPDGYVSKFDNYPWDKADKHTFNTVCPWYNELPTTIPPFWKKFDGPHRHALTQLNRH